MNDSEILKKLREENRKEKFFDSINSKLTKDDLYEIEKILDNYSAEIIKCQNDLCKTAIHWTATNKELISPVDDKIKAYQESYAKIKSIRDKLEKMRLKA